MRESLYTAALSWFSVRPQSVQLYLLRLVALSLTDFLRWSYGANRVQLDVDIKLLSEVLSYLQADAIRGYPAISSLHAAAQSKTTRKI